MEKRIMCELRLTLFDKRKVEKNEGCIYWVHFFFLHVKLVILITETATGMDGMLTDNTLKVL